ncbi:hypothetical protein PQ465_08070 [Sphingobacterium oryzagri]|uniref:DUF2946 domain-containing protein n=1 Tax=Sphingobacterium oryzagri TaxID=3025669 RepID=A0ABY7WL56_9SPHI|nr:hypothetical protein [Sphingobacterium sp. KACC 22765]WDF70323.1 hypothetical protein PQ465_08070 [Sphingobacterium sp. KACC 22765]
MYVVIGLIGLLSTSALQYTHDRRHQHTCETRTPHDTHQQSTAADDCSLCWFVSHQVTPDLTIYTPLPDVAENILVHLNSATVNNRYQSITLLRKSNKDPPFLV